MLTLVNHDLKSPLNATIGFAELWLAKLRQTEQAVDRQELIEDLETMLAASGDMLKLINDSLAAVRLETGQVAIEARWENEPGGIFSSVGETFRHEAANARIALQIDVPANLPPVYWDIFKIRCHVINNLVSNALKFTQAGGLVRLSVRQEDDRVAIRVADNGPGIPPEERNKIFHRFERLEVQAHRAYQGSGLGLYSANLFVRHHGGSISVEDGLDGAGVTFKVAIPAYPQFEPRGPVLCPVCADSTTLAAA